MTTGTTERMTRTPNIFIARTPNLLIAGILALALGVAAVGVAQTAGAGGSDTTVADAKSNQAANAALQVVEGGRVVSVSRDDEGAATWAVRVFKPAQPLESFGEQRTAGRHVVVYLDRDMNWIEAKVEGYGPPAK
ncbi:MAG TPA: hypothetical protein VFB51_10980 [Solirubrobacterales bacterium]|nr:hypothetical protein [Solirubrobacterales bacterium]